MNYLTADKIRVIGRFSIQNIKEIDVTGKVAEFSYNNVDLLEKIVYNGVDIAT